MSVGSAHPTNYEHVDALTPFILLHLPAWLLVLFRITGIFIFSPMLGGLAIPRQVKVALALALSVCVYPALVPGPFSPAWSPPQQAMASIMAGDLNLWFIAPVVLAELMVGIAIGFVATLPIAAMQLGGRVIDQQMGLAFAQIVNPELGEESSPVAEIYFIAALSLFIIANGHLAMIDILLSTFHHVGLGTFQADGFLLDLLVTLVDTTFALAIRVAAPLLAAVFLVEAAMGFMMRSVPQINIMTIGFIVRILVGAVVLVGGVTMMHDTFFEAWQGFLGELRRFLSQ